MNLKTDCNIFFLMLPFFSSGGIFVQRSSGNFLLQALLAVSLVFAFVPFMTRQLAGRDQNSQMYAVTRQVENASTAARIYIRENVMNLPYGETVLTGNALADTLEPYGLPLGFVSRTALGQDISLVITKTPDEVAGRLDITGGDLSILRRAELARRIGFYAAPTDQGIIVGVPLEEEYSDVVRRAEANPDANGFLVNLDMGGFSINNVGLATARNGVFDSFQSRALTLSGVENGRKVRHNIAVLSTGKTIFQSVGGTAALSVSRGTLRAESASVKTIAQFGDTGSLTTDSASVYDFYMTAGRTSFTGPGQWSVQGNVIADNMNFSVDSLEISSYINAARGQDVYINPDSLQYSSRSGLEVGRLSTSNITLRDQTSDALARGETGAIVLDVRPGGTSVFYDVLSDTIDNNGFKIIARADDDEGRQVDCRSIISALGGTYNQRSLAQYIICQYVFWTRLEQRIDIKQCMLEGKSDCR